MHMSSACRAVFLLQLTRNAASHKGAIGHSFRSARRKICRRRQFAWAMFKDINIQL